MPDWVSGRGISLSGVSFVLIAGLLAGTSHATTQDYVLDFPAGQMIAYKIEFQVSHPGRVSLKMDWSPNRVISFKLEGPEGGPPALRRSGPPPQRLYYDVDSQLAAVPGTWKLSIRGLPSHDVASGGLILQLPDARPAVESPVSQASRVPATPRDPWRAPRSAPRSSSPGLTRLYEATERFRIAVVEESGRDRYDWQEDLLRYLAERRDGHTEMPNPETVRMLKRSADAVRRVEKFATSRDPFVVSPPSDPGLFRAWMSLRDRRVMPLELELDSMLHSIRKGHVPELEPAAWFGRFMICLIACEHHFEERGRLGEDEAINADVVAEQWERLLLAADALDSLAAIAEPKTTD